MAIILVEARYLSFFLLYFFMYEEFLKANQDPQSIIQALTSGILTPDPKGLILLAMNPKEAYTRKELYERVLDFYGLGLIEFPLTAGAAWGYLNGSKGVKGSLESIGAVVRLRIKESGGNYVTAYQKTDAGRDFGDPTVAIGTYVVNELSRMKAKYCSLWRILGACHSKYEYRRGFVVSRIIKLLAENPESKFTLTEISNELKLDQTTASHALNSLAKAGVIGYFSPHIDVEGKRNKGWAKYILAKELDEDDKIIEEAKDLRPKFTSSGCLRKTIDYIRRHPNEAFEHNKLSKELGIDPSSTSQCLSILSELGYLESQLKGEKTKSVVRANECTKVLWEELFGPIERVAYSLNPYDSKFRERLEYYQNHEEEWKNAVKRQLEIYNEERSQIGVKGGEEIRRLILLVLSQHKEGMKASHIYQKVNEISSRKLSYHSILSHLRYLERIGMVKNLERGYYRQT